MISSVLRRAWPSLALAATFLLIVAFVVRACYFRNDIYFLAERAPACWIIYPVPGFGGIRPGVALDAVFRRSFSLASVPAAAKLDLRAFRSGTVSLNGKAVPAELDADHWKAGASRDVAHFCARGKRSGGDGHQCVGPARFVARPFLPGNGGHKRQVVGGIVGRRHLAAGGLGRRPGPAG